jgi:hypothetical protein
LLGVISYAQCIGLPDVILPKRENGKANETTEKYAVSPIPISEVMQPSDEQTCKHADQSSADKIRGASQFGTKSNPAIRTRKIVWIEHPPTLAVAEHRLAFGADWTECIHDA